MTDLENINKVDDHNMSHDNDPNGTNDNDKDRINDDPNMKLIKKIRKELQKLEMGKKRYEKEGTVIKNELFNDSDPPIGFDTPLVDKDGYPRSDIDILRIRTIRNEYHIIQTNHTKIMKQIEEYLIQLNHLLDEGKPSQLQQNRLNNNNNEIELRLLPKPKPKFDPISKKWVVKNWDGTITGDSVSGSGSGSNINGDMMVVDQPTTTKRFYDDIPSLLSTIEHIPTTTAETAAATPTPTDNSTCTDTAMTVAPPVNDTVAVTVTDTTISMTIEHNNNQIESTPNKNNLGQPQQHQPKIHHPAPVDIVIRKQNDDECYVDDDNNDNKEFITIQKPQWNAYARVNSVLNDSPSYHAGLLPNDLIVAFGPIIKKQHYHHEDIDDDHVGISSSLLLIKIRELVERAYIHQETIEVIVERRTLLTSSLVYVSLLLYPQQLASSTSMGHNGGGGKLGCHLIPL